MTSILVVLYGKEIQESLTLCSLNSFVDKGNELRLTIWNNGPEVVEEINSEFLKNISSVNLIQNCENETLSQIYNKFINENDSEQFVILDDDSELSKEYVKYISEKKVREFGCPLLKQSGQTISPKFFSKADIVQGSVSSKSGIVGLGSGIVLSSSLVDKCKRTFGSVFDERFTFYGVDTTIFYRLEKLENFSIDLLPMIAHNLSLSERDKITDFKKKELAASISLRLRYYYSHRQLFTLCKKVLGDLLKFRRSLDYKVLIMTLVSGKNLSRRIN